MSWTDWIGWAGFVLVVVGILAGWAMEIYEGDREQW